MSEEVLELPGLNGQNPLGFFAALGLLRILDDVAVRGGKARPRLAFRATPPFTARLWCNGLTLQDIKDAVLADARAQGSSVALRLAYDDNGLACAPEAKNATRDLKPPPALARQYLAAAAGAGRREADLAGALLSDTIQDNNGASKPTAFHFTMGNQAFLAMVEKLRDGMTDELLDEALIGPWLNRSELPSLAWDSSITRLYALRATNPGPDKRGTVAGANWLAVHGLAFFPVMPVRLAQRLAAATSSVGIGWKDVAFCWPLWQPPAGTEVIRSLLSLDFVRRDSTARTTLGIFIVWRSRILRPDRYGSFSPPEVVPPTPNRRPAAQ